MTASATADGYALTSAGAGVRFFLGDDLQADIGVAAPLSYRAPDNTTRSARLLFSVVERLQALSGKGTGALLVIRPKHPARPLGLIWPEPI